LAFGRTRRASGCLSFRKVQVDGKTLYLWTITELQKQRALRE
jgi:hypothetical protein